MAAFEWGVALHDLDFEAIRNGTKDKKQLRDELKAIGKKARWQITKDYISYPALSAAASAGVAKVTKGRWLDSGRAGYKATLVADAIANVVRNVWSHAIIFCGHFPDQTFMFTEEEVQDESRGAWYVRQLIGAANIDGGPFFHVMSGNLSFQVEHHLFPDMPSSRYQQIAPRVKEICERYGLPYNTGPLRKQWGTVQRTIARLAFPGGGPRPKPGPYKTPPEERAARDRQREAVPAFP
jgi:linoleoyl-CoA desaturase